MIYAAPGATFTASTDPTRTGLTGTIGVRIMQGATTVTARATAGISESPAGSGIYTKSDLVAPATAGSYLVVWDTGGGTPTWLDEELTVTYTAASISAPTGRDLCTVADVKALMQKGGPNAAAQDTLIQSLITRVSIKIMRDYGREFVPGGANSEPATNATRTFEYTWGDQFPGEAFVDFRPYDLQKTPAPAVLVDTDQVGTPITLSVEEWRLWPYPASQGVFMGIKVLPLNMNIGLIGWRKRQLTITGNWGFPSIPYEVTQACAETVIHWLTSYPAARRPDAVDMTVVPVTPRSYPMPAVDLLSSFKRMTI